MKLASVRVDLFIIIIIIGLHFTNKFRFSFDQVRIGMLVRFRFGLVSKF